MDKREERGRERERERERKGGNEGGRQGDREGGRRGVCTYMKREYIHRRVRKVRREKGDAFTNKKREFSTKFGLYFLSNPFPHLLPTLF